MLIALLVIALAVAALLVVAARRPPAFRFERTAHIAAPPERIAPLITDFRAWTRWSPWEHLDPDLQRTYSGAATGVGAIYDWAGNGKAGAGRMEIVETTPQRIVIQLDFIKPMTAHNHAEFTLTPAAGGTELRWAMYGPHPFVHRLMGVVFSMDKMLGPAFEEGLAKIRQAAEAG
jgi:uncharacterized protein YndB with AHSA1/START domain